MERKAHAGHSAALVTSVCRELRDPLFFLEILRKVSTEDCAPNVYPGEETPGNGYPALLIFAEKDLCVWPVLSPVWIPFLSAKWS